MKIYLKGFIVTTFLLLFPVLVSGWGNGNPYSNKYPNYGIHDVIAEYSYFKLRDFNPTKAKWLTDWYTSDYTQLDYGDTAENYLGWTDDSDSVIKDWDNHNCEINTGYRGTAPVCGTPSRVKQLYDLMVNNLVIWIRTGMPDRSPEEKEAAKAAALITHYYGDISQTMHTDETRTGKPEHSYPEDDPFGRTYHSYYESFSITDEFIDQVRLDLNAYLFPVDVKVTDVSGAVRSYAEYSNAHDGKTIELKGNTIVGTFYWYVVDTFKKLYDAVISYLGARGYDQKLYLETIENVKLVVGNITQLFYTAYEEAELKAGQPDIIDTVEACVVINEFLPNPDLPPKKGGVEWVELYNKCKSTFDISNYILDDEEGGSAPKTIPSGTIIAGNGFWSFTLYKGDGYLNNAGDTMRFLKQDGSVIDQRSFTNAPPDSSQFRLPDGGLWQDVWDTTPTRDGPNG